jgi:hypothetical protein
MSKLPGIASLLSISTYPVLGLLNIVAALIIGLVGSTHCVAVKVQLDNPDGKSNCFNFFCSGILHSGILLSLAYS